MELSEQLQATLGHAYLLGRELGGGGMSRVSRPRRQARPQGRRLALDRRRWLPVLEHHHNPFAFGNVRSPADSRGSADVAEPTGALVQPGTRRRRVYCHMRRFSDISRAVALATIVSTAIAPATVTH